jgi:hypothetical protein
MIWIIKLRLSRMLFQNKYTLTTLNLLSYSLANMLETVAFSEQMLDT